VKDRAPDAIVNLGDCFSGPLDVVRTHDLLSDAGITATVRGNHDRVLIDGVGMDGWDRMAYPKVTDAMRGWLSTLPVTAVLDEVFLCHATPASDTAYWIDAYTHVARSVHLADGRLLVNPGALGSPGFIDDAPRDNRRVSSGTPFALYAVLDRRNAVWTASQHMVPYDTGPAISMARAAGCADWEQALSTGWL
jgi:hypothetical protein